MLTEHLSILLTALFKDFNLTFKGRDGRLLATVMHSNCKFKSTSPESKSKAMLVEEYSEENKQIVRPPYLTEGGPARNATGLSHPYEYRYYICKRSGRDVSSGDPLCGSSAGLCGSCGRIGKMYSCCFGKKL